MQRSSARYRVGSEDTLVTLADRFNVTTEQLRRWNHLRSSTLRNGQPCSSRSRRTFPRLQEASVGARHAVAEERTANHPHRGRKEGEPRLNRSQRSHRKCGMHATCDLLRWIRAMRKRFPLAFSGRPLQAIAIIRAAGGVVDICARCHKRSQRRVKSRRHRCRTNESS